MCFLQLVFEGNPELPNQLPNAPTSPGPAKTSKVYTMIATTQFIKPTRGLVNIARSLWSIWIYGGGRALNSQACDMSHVGVSFLRLPLFLVQEKPTGQPLPVIFLKMGAVDASTTHNGTRPFQASVLEAHGK